MLGIPDQRRKALEMKDRSPNAMQTAFFEMDPESSVQRMVANGMSIFPYASSAVVIL